MSKTFFQLKIIVLLSFFTNRLASEILEIVKNPKFKVVEHMLASKSFLELEYLIHKIKLTYLNNNLDESKFEFVSVKPIRARNKHYDRAEVRY